MMSNMPSPKEVPVWGFPDNELQNWPSVLKPIPLIQLPIPGLITVHAAAANSFQHIVLEELLPLGKKQNAILYLPPHLPEPKDTWSYFVHVVDAGDWEALLKALDCPQQYEVFTWADDIDIEPLAIASTNILPNDLLARSTDILSQGIQEHLQECSICRESFLVALQQRIENYRRLFCPPLERRVAYQRGSEDIWVAKHLPECADCRATLKAFMRLFATPQRLTLNISLGQAKELTSRFTIEFHQQTEKATKNLQSWLQEIPSVVPTFVAALVGAQVRPAFAQVLGGETRRQRQQEGAAQPIDPLQSSLERLQTTGRLPMIGNVQGRTINWTLRWNRAMQGIALSLYDQYMNPIQDFSAKLRWNGHVQSTPGSNGDVVIPLELLAEMVASTDASIVFELSEPESEQRHQ